MHLDEVLSLAERRSDLKDFIVTSTLDPVHGTQEELLLSNARGGYVGFQASGVVPELLKEVPSAKRTAQPAYTAGR